MVRLDQDVSLGPDVCHLFFLQHIRLPKYLHCVYVSSVLLLDQSYLFTSTNNFKLISFFNRCFACQLNRLLLNLNSSSHPSHIRQTQVVTFCSVENGTMTWHLKKYLKFVASKRVQIVLVGRKICFNIRLGKMNCYINSLYILQW